MISDFRRAREARFRGILITTWINETTYTDDDVHIRTERIIQASSGGSNLDGDSQSQNLLPAQQLNWISGGKIRFPIIYFNAENTTAYRERERERYGGRSTNTSTFTTERYILQPVFKEAKLLVLR